MSRKSTGGGHPWLWTIAGILASLVALYFIIHISLEKFTRHNQEYEVPDFYGLQVEEAQMMADEYGFRLEVTDSVYSKVLGRGAIFRQNPTKGSKVKQGRRIILTINSRIAKKVEMPLLVGYSLRQARTELSARGLQLAKLKYIDDMATNNVLSQEYNGKPVKAGTMIPYESRITLVVGQNPQDAHASIPDVIGYTYKMAKDIVYDNSFNIDKCIFDDTVLSYADTLSSAVYRQMPSPGYTEGIQRGSDVTLYFTNDPSKIVRKSITDESEDEESVPE